MIIGPDKVPGTQVAPEVNVTLFHSIPYEYFFQAVGELEKAASWKGLIGSTLWINMYRSHKGDRESPKSQSEEI
ncbi:MAG: hypothetical protein D3924_12205 [Candidatus Electrothrix sp. AR4]|nr:hypothetical protein [Candidatus Electrothrix sp. AR4]